MVPAPLLVALIAVVLVAIVIPLWARRGRRRAAAARRAIDQQHCLRRVSAEVRAGGQQALTVLAHELHLPRYFEDLPYGALYLDPQTEQRHYLRTRAETGHGFLGLLQATRHLDTETTSVGYSVVRLPADEYLHPRILQFEHDLLAAIHRLDPDAIVHATTEGSREYDSPDLPG